MRNDESTGCFVGIERLGQLKHLGLDAKQRDTTTSNDAFFNGGLGGADRVFDAVLLFLQFNFSSGADLEHCNTTGKLGQTFLELFAVVVGIGALNFCLDLRNASSDICVFARTFDNGGFILGDDDFASLTEKVNCGVLNLEPDVFSNDLTTGEDCDVLHHCLATVTEARGLHGNGVEGATDLVHNECCERFAFDVFSNDHKRT